MVEKPHPDDLCGKSVVVINNSSEYISPSDGTCPTRFHSGCWSLLVDPLMGSGSVVECHIFRQHVAEMSLIQNEDVIQSFLSDLPYPVLSDSVSLWGTRWCPDNIHSH